MIILQRITALVIATPHGFNLLIKQSLEQSNGDWDLSVIRCKEVNMLTNCKNGVLRGVVKLCAFACRI